MSGRLELDFSKVLDGILAAARHFRHLFEDEIVKAGRVRDGRSNPQIQQRYQSSHRRGINGKIPIEQRRVACG